jgi:hypothetical protein
MKNIFYILILCSLVSCSKKESITKQDIKTIKGQANTLITNWHLAASEANYDNYFNVMDSVSVFIGTDATENWTKSQFKNFSKPYFDKGKAWDFKTIERNIYVNVSGNFVWFDELLDTWMGTCRGSGVLEKTESNWKLKHYVLSVSIPNEDIKSIIAIKKENDSIFLQKK